MLLNKKILVVEDNEINRAALVAILAPEYTILEAENGSQALSVLEKYGVGISLILLDIYMPVMDGYTFLQHIKADPRVAAVPVIVTTSNDSEEDEVAALAHGATDFLTKPYRPQIILHRIAGITHLRETSALINELRYDRVTGVYSKEFFCQQARDILYGNPDVKYDILCSDIEDFKLINDTFGVAAGDRLLQQVAGLYTQRLGDHGICGRMGADQFACLLEHREDYSDEMFTQSDTRINSGFGDQNVVMKYGIYTVEDREVSVEQICDRALLAAQSIKGKYGRHFALYDDNLRGKLLRRQAITDCMETALDAGQFEVYLQPKYQIWDGWLAGAEALVRWNHPEWGLQPPAEFIPIFERNGFITKLDQYVWEQVCALLQEWDKKGYPAISISVNVSRMDIHNTDLTEVLSSMVQRYGLAPSRLHLEITESAYTETPKRIVETLGCLHKLGFIIEMDDFGSGYSSLNMLTEMPIDVLKLDMKFIHTEITRPSGQGILPFIVSMARWMKLSVVAEGVETREQLERLQLDGCDYAQGYYFAKPMPVRDFEAILSASPPTGVTVSSQSEASAVHRERILLVADEDAEYRAQVRRTFSDRFEVREAVSCEDTLRVLGSSWSEVAAVILSMTLPESGSLRILDAVQKERGGWEVQIIAAGPLELEQYAIEHGAADYAAKPHSQKVLRRRVLRAVSIHSLQERTHVLQDEACRDSMTGLLNRRGLDTITETLRREAASAVFMFDLDELKQFNDKYGHVEGDHLIIHFASLLRAHTRADDVLVRLGGDEFLVVMRQMRSLDDALKKGADICHAFYRSRYADLDTAACSAGVALWHDKEPIQEIIRRADEALYAAKNSGRGECMPWKGANEC
ncbi:EAL domain-containing protein [Ruminococcus gauvreauii]|uniref:Stage 0 sporulation protein A homolog n=1 Tax=Ruminococcus gauvreauii TaxID=438033 RepID=A0ABY5VGX4_9FIRM|nr:EAL domain-containing protein [Ruminococcus gauvreauii]UWP59627.1 EAL domain-containing protein [Ruminococcus gauvreauii]